MNIGQQQQCCLLLQTPETPKLRIPNCIRHWKKGDTVESRFSEGKFSEDSWFSEVQLLLTILLLLFSKIKVDLAKSPDLAKLSLLTKNFAKSGFYCTKLKKGDQSLFKKDGWLFTTEKMVGKNCWYTCLTRWVLEECAKHNRDKYIEEESAWINTLVPIQTRVYAMRLENIFGGQTATSCQRTK